MPNQLDKSTIVFIDGVRGLAALAVLVTHSFDFGIRGVFGEDMLTAPESWRWAVATIGHGSFFVWVFFVISGLCIQQSIGRSLAQGTFNISSYFVARITRIYPLFLLGLLLAAAVWAFTADPDPATSVKHWPQFCSSLLSLQIFTGTFPNYMPSWSLSNEMVYYAAWPIALLILRRNTERTIAFSVAASVAVCALIATSWMLSHSFETRATVKGMWIVSVLYPLWLGGAYLATRWDGVSQFVTRRLWIASIGFCIIAELALAVAKYFDGSEFLIYSISPLAIPGIMLFVAGARHAGLASRPRLQRISGWLGQFSYPCYTLHMPILVLFNRQLLPHLGPRVNADPLMRSVVQFLPVFLLLAVGGPWLERGVMRWRSRCLAKRRGIAPHIPAPNH